jgi:hypothetical protein
MNSVGTDLGEGEEDCKADKKPEDDGGEKAPVLSS